MPQLQLLLLKFYSITGPRYYAGMLAHLGLYYIATVEGWFLVGIHNHQDTSKVLGKVMANGSVEKVQVIALRDDGKPEGRFVAPYTLEDLPPNTMVVDDQGFYGTVSSQDPNEGSVWVRWEVHGGRTKDACYLLGDFTFPKLVPIGQSPYGGPVYARSPHGYPTIFGDAK